jgi:hypothetical protein
MGEAPIITLQVYFRREGNSEAKIARHARGDNSPFFYGGGYRMAGKGKGSKKAAGAKILTAMNRIRPRVHVACKK